jgi:addiction module HigA family antidote
MGVDLTPIHPGEILRDLYLTPLGLSAGALARRLNVPRTRIERLIEGHTALSVDTALRLARFFNTTPQYWINLQTAFELGSASRDVIEEIERIEPLQSAA